MDRYTDRQDRQIDRLEIDRQTENIQANGQIDRQISDRQTDK